MRHRLPALVAAVVVMALAAPEARAAAAAAGRSTKDLIQAGVTALEESNFARADARFREAAAIDPRMPQAQLGLGLAALGEHDRKGAERALRLALQTSDGAPETRYALGIAHFVFDDLRAAAEDLKAAATADRYFIEAEYAAGIVAASRGDLPGAAVALREALRIDASHAASHYQLGAVLARSGDLDGALLELGRALAIDPVIVDARPEDPIVFAARSVRSTAAGGTLGLPLPVLRPSIAWPRPRLGLSAAVEGIPEWFLYYEMARDLSGAGQWRGVADMLERALTFKDRSEIQAIVASRLVDYCPHLRLAEAYQHLGNFREAALHLGIARNEESAQPEALRALEVLIVKDRLRPRILLGALPDRTTEETVTVRGLILADEPAARVEVGGREAVLRPATNAEVSALLPPGDLGAPREGGSSTLFEVAAYRLPALGPNLIAIQPSFRNPARDGDRIEVLVVRLPQAKAAPKDGAKPSSGAP